jgi:hypothetical protein
MPLAEIKDASAYENGDGLAFLRFYFNQAESSNIFPSQ